MIYVIFSDNQNFLIPVFASLFNRFFDDKLKVIALCYEVPRMKLPDNFELVSIGEDTGPDCFCQTVAEYFDQVKDDYITLMLGDCLICRQVDLGDYEFIIDFSSANRIARFDLSSRGNRYWSENDACVVLPSGKRLLYTTKHSPHLAALAPSVWKRELLVTLLKECDTAQSLEKKGLDLSYGSVYGSTTTIVNRLNFEVKGRISWQSLDVIDKIVFIEMIDAGDFDSLIDVLGKSNSTLLLAHLANLVNKTMTCRWIGYSNEVDSVVLDKSFKNTLVFKRTMRSDEYYRRVCLLAKHLDLKFKSVFEIGGGYGGFCEALNDSVALEQYAIVDTPSMLRVCEWYLREHDLSSVNLVSCQEFDDLSGKFDLFVSHHCLAEVPKEYVKQVLEFVASHCKKFFILDTKNYVLPDWFVKKFNITEVEWIKKTKAWFGKRKFLSFLR